MAQDPTLYDSQQGFQGGMQGGFDPGHVADDQYHLGTNLSVRNGVAGPRPSYKERELDFTNIQELYENTSNSVTADLAANIAEYDSVVTDIANRNSKLETIADNIKTRVPETEEYTNPVDYFSFIGNNRTIDNQFADIFGIIGSDIDLQSSFHPSYIRAGTDSIHKLGGMAGFSLHAPNHGESGFTTIPDILYDGTNTQTHWQHINKSISGREAAGNTYIGIAGDFANKLYYKEVPYGITKTPQANSTLTADLIAVLILGERCGLYNRGYANANLTSSTTLTQQHVDDLQLALYGEYSLTARLEHPFQIQNINPVFSNNTSRRYAEAYPGDAITNSVNTGYTGNTTQAGVNVVSDYSITDKTKYRYNADSLIFNDYASHNGPTDNNYYESRNIAFIRSAAQFEERIDADLETEGIIVVKMKKNPIWVESYDFNEPLQFGSWFKAGVQAQYPLLNDGTDIEVNMGGVPTLISKTYADAFYEAVGDLAFKPFISDTYMPKIGDTIYSINPSTIKATVTAIHWEQNTPTLPITVTSENNEQYSNNEINNIDWNVFIHVKDIKHIESNTDLTLDEKINLGTNAFGNKAIQVDQLNPNGTESNNRAFDNDSNLTAQEKLNINVVFGIHHNRYIDNLSGVSQYDAYGQFGHSPDYLLPAWSNNYGDENTSIYYINYRKKYNEKRNTLLKRGIYEDEARTVLAAEPYGLVTTFYEGFDPVAGANENRQNINALGIENEEQYLVNQNFDVDQPTIAPWTGRGPVTTTRINDGTADSSPYYVRVTGRSLQWHGLSQDVDITDIEQFKYFTGSAKLRHHDNPINKVPGVVRLNLYIKYTDNSQQTVDFGSINLTSTSQWVTLSSTKQVNFSAGKTIQQVALRVVGGKFADNVSGYGLTNSFDVDTLSLIGEDTPGLNLVRGFNSGEWIEKINNDNNLKDVYASINRQLITIQQSIANWEELFKNGKFQGSDIYKTPNTTYAVIVISGHIYTVDLETFKVNVLTNVATVLDQNIDRVFMVQAESHFIIQDGIQKPRIITGSQLTISNTAEDQVPTGTNMAYGQGRLSVQISPKHFVIGDIHLSFEPDNVLNFKETKFLNEGGGFTVSGKLGKIVSLQFANVADTSTGDGPLLAICENGFSTFAINNPRSQWSNIAIQKVQMIGTSMTGTNAYVNINEDILYRSPEGVRSYAVGRSEANSGFRFSEITREVQDFIDTDSTSSDVEKVRLAYFDKRLLITNTAGSIFAKGNEYDKYSDYLSNLTTPNNVIPADSSSINERYITQVLSFINNISSSSDVTHRGLLKIKRHPFDILDITEDNYEDLYGNTVLEEIYNARIIKIPVTDAQKITDKITLIKNLPETTADEKEDKVYHATKFFEEYELNDSANESHFEYIYQYSYCNRKIKENTFYDTIFKGLISFDFSLSGYTKSTKTSQTARLKSGSYDGIWTGLNILDIFTVINKGQKNCFLWTKNSQQQNAIYELTTETTGTDYSVSNKYVPIEQSINLRAMPFKTAQTYIDSPFLYKHIEEVTMWLDNIHDDVNIKCLVKSDVLDEFTEIGQLNVKASTSSNDPTQVGAPQSRAMIRLKDMQDQYKGPKEHPVRDGNEFQFRLEWNGNVQIRRFLASARAITPPKLVNDEIEKNVYPIDTTNLFSYNID